MVKQVELEALVLQALYGHYQARSNKLELSEVNALLSVEVTEGRVEMALETLRSSGYVETTRVVYSGQRFEYWLSEDGYKYAEEILDRAEREQPDDPLAQFDAKLVPASDRMVSFDDNHRDKVHAIQTIEEAEKIVRSSNKIDDDLKEQTLLSVKTGRTFLEEAESFAVGAFRFLIWDRLKAVVETAIEETLKVALTALLMTLGAIVIGLL